MQGSRVGAVLINQKKYSKIHLKNLIFSFYYFKNGKDMKYIVCIL